MGSLIRGLLFLWGLAWLISVLRGPAPDVEAPRRPSVERPPDQHYVPQPSPRRGGLLPPPSEDDPVVLVEPDRKRGATVGTAFALHEEGVWVTARHVVSDCRQLAIRGSEGWAELQLVWLHPRADMAIVRSRGAPVHFALSPEDVSYDQDGYGVGYPQARPGAVHGHLIGRTRMRSPGLFTGMSSTLAWAEADRQPAISGSLGGISGGPLFDEAGRVIGVIVAEVPRRGRFETLAPEVLRAVATRAELLPDAATPALALPFRPEDFGRVGEHLRRQYGVALVGCST